MIKDGAGHHPHSLRDPTLIADFIVRSLEPASGASPAFAGKKFTKSSFYGVENTYRDFPKEGMYITCRGPWFSECYDRYEFKPDSTTGTVAVIAPKIAAPGKPWVLRADFVTRDAVVDLALLHKGFHIVTGPRPTGHQWHGSARVERRLQIPDRPRLFHEAGHGRRRRERPGKPTPGPSRTRTRSVASTARIPSCAATCRKRNRSIIWPRWPRRVCTSSTFAAASIRGSNSQTRVAEKRYQELGGQITVIVKEGEGHYPLAPKERQPVVDFIIKRVAAAGSPSVK